MRLTPPSPREGGRGLRALQNLSAPPGAPEDGASVLECAQSSAALDFAARRPSGVKSIALSILNLLDNCSAFQRGKGQGQSMKEPGQHCPRGARCCFAEKLADKAVRAPFP